MDPENRKKSPGFYGYIPDGGSRTAIFGCMVLNSALLLLVRSSSAAMLMLVKKRYFLAYMAGDMALYLLQKVVRGDFHYWLPLDGVFGLFVSLMARVVVKTITDFTGVIQYRHPGEVGGLYWTASMFLALLASVGSVWFYVESGGREVSERAAWMLVGYLGGGWVITFGLFLGLMKKQYRRTFFDTKSGKRMTMDKFKNNEDEGVKAGVVTDNKHLWREIRGEVKAWVLGNWYRWVEEKPIWFTEAWVSKVPNDMVPDDEDESKLREIRKLKRRWSTRRSSCAADVLGRNGGARVHPK